ncbi:MAG: flippase-like domain-containing protein [Lachnospiraceae bacterium]|nr:flippase-like domain-containing protein [Lachnospiraceae bacterium]
MEETPLKQKKTSPWLIAAFVLMNVGVLLWTGLSELNRRNEDTAGFSQIRFRWGFLVLSVLFFAVAFAAETLKYYSMMRQMTERKDYGTAFRVALYGRYYDNITPSGAGGQPFQIYFLRRCGLPLNASFAIPIFAFVTQQLVFVALSLFAFLVFGGRFAHPTIKVTAFIGLIFYSLVPVTIILSARFPDLTGKVACLLIRLLVKLRIVKDPEAAAEKAQVRIREYSEAMAFLNSKKYLVWRLVGLSVIYHLARASLPFFILHAFGGSGSWLDITIATFFIYAAITIIPTPGGAGAAEASFYLVFSGLPDPGLVFWAMLLWRFFSYYIYIIGGFLLTVSDFFRAGRTGQTGLDP